MKTTSEITGIYYEDEMCVFYRNYIQAAYYIEWGAKLVDIFTDSNHKLVFVFYRSDHEKYIERWKLTQELIKQLNEREMSEYEESGKTV